MVGSGQRGGKIAILSEIRNIFVAPCSGDKINQTSQPLFQIPKVSDDYTRQVMKNTDLIYFDIQNGFDKVSNCCCLENEGGKTQVPG